MLGSCSSLIHLWSSNPLFFIIKIDSNSASITSIRLQSMLPNTDLIDYYEVHTSTLNSFRIFLCLPFNGLEKVRSVLKDGVTVYNLGGGLIWYAHCKNGGMVWLNWSMNDQSDHWSSKRLLCRCVFHRSGPSWLDGRRGITNVQIFLGNTARQHPLTVIV